MSKRKKTTRRAPMPAAKLSTGWVGPNGTRIRMARVEETDAVNKLMEEAGVRLIPAVRTAIEDGTVATTLRKALEGGSHRALLEAVAHAFTEDINPLPTMSLPLTAVDENGRLIGAALITPPASLMNQFMAEASTQGTAYGAFLAAMVAKIHGLAVAETASGQGIGSSLLACAWKTYRALDIKIMYGAFETRRDLGDFYTKCGYTVHPDGEGVPLGPMFPARVTITPLDGERLFSRRAAGFLV